MVYLELIYYGEADNIFPNYWHAKYLTGFKKIPNDLLNVLGMLASINVLNIAGDIILGAGIASYSLSLDGLSQSISSTSSATNSGYGARIIPICRSNQTYYA